MRVARALGPCLAVVLATMALPVAGQEGTSRGAFLSPVVTVDQDRLFNGSQYGQSIVAQLEERGVALAAENRRIEAELAAEEQELTDLRDSLPSEEFRARAVAFDEKVVAIRATQDEKTSELVALRDNARSKFVADIVPIMAEILRERGAVALLDKRSVVLSAGQIDITDDVIDRVDAAYSSLQTGTPEVVDDGGTQTETDDTGQEAPQPE